MVLHMAPITLRYPLQKKVSGGRETIDPQMQYSIGPGSIFMQFLAGFENN